jgi:transcription-repair coupling factor (superfamily II helicase)
MELFAPYYTQPLASLADYLAAWKGDGPEKAPLLALDDPDLIRLEAQEIERQAADLYRGFIDNGELPPGLRSPYLAWDEVAAHSQGLPILSIGGGAEGAIEVPHFAPPRLYAGNIGAAITDIKAAAAEQARVVIVSQQSSRLRELLEDEDVYPTVRKGRAPATSGAPPGAPPQSDVVGVEQVELSAGGKGIAESLPGVPSTGSVNLLQGNLQAGWAMSFGDVRGTVLLTDAELFGRIQMVRRQAPGPTRRSAADQAALLREKMLLELQTGDYVVHVEHGIARYGGLVKMEREGNERE